jgi:hypothetical protein
MLDCWELASNASKRPHNNGAKSTMVEKLEPQLVMEIIIVEFILTAMSFPSNQKFPNNPNVGIGDTGVSVHVTLQKSGFIEKERKASSADTIVMGKWHQ